MFRYEVQFLGRASGDYDRHVDAATQANVAGAVAFRSYYFAGIKSLIVLVESGRDRDAVVRALPRADLVGVWEIGVGAQAAA